MSKSLKVGINSWQKLELFWGKKRVGKLEFSCMNAESWEWEGSYEERK